MSYFRGDNPDCMYTYPSRNRNTTEDYDLEPDYYLDLTPEENERIMESLRKITKDWKDVYVD